MKELNCIFCSRIINNAGSLAKHQKECKLNPDRIIYTSGFVFYNRKRQDLGLPGENQYTKAKRLGIDPPVISDETRKKMSDSQQNRIWTDERRTAQSISMKKAVKDNPESYSSNNVCGRNKQVEYNGVKMNSTWEVTVAKWFDESGIEWQRNKTGFKYHWGEKGTDHTYFPDFYLPVNEVYIEVKGYETERDRCKWKVLDNLIILKEKEIKQIKKGLIPFVLKYLISP